MAISRAQNTRSMLGAAKTSVKMPAMPSAPVVKTARAAELLPPKTSTKLVPRTPKRQGPIRNAAVKGFK